MRIDFHTREQVLDEDHADSPSSYFLHIRAELVEVGDCEDEDEVVGHASACVYRHEYAEEHGINLFDVGDSIDQDKHSAWCAVMDYNGQCLKPKLSSDGEGFRTNNLLYVERMQIAASHRSRGLGLLLMLRLIRQFGADCAIVIIEPHPLNHTAERDGPETDEAAEWRERMEWEQLEADTPTGVRKLRKHWQQLGFKRVPGSKTHFYLDLESEDLPDDVEITRHEYIAE